VFVQELARCGSGGVAAGIGAHSGIALPPIWKFGTEEHKQRYLVPGIRGELIAALAITEPDAGSDVASIRTSAKRVDGGFLVNGSKMFITGGCRADVLVTAVKTTAEGGHHGISFLLIDRGPGVTSTAIEKMGWHASDTALITFDDVFVPEENLLGAEHQGFYLIMANFQWERLLMALGAVGAMEFVFDRTLRFAADRQAFGRPIGKHQAIRHKLASMATKIEAARDMTYTTAWRWAEGQYPVREISMTKLFTSQIVGEVCDDAIQIHGGAGYMEEYLVERIWRDVRLYRIGAGTDEIMLDVIGRSLV
jgi:alkylation response protein AidB-like acyl-CoA dehydrogenase